MSRDGGTSWRFAAASAVGTSHLKSGLPCQDTHLCDVLRTADGEPVLAAFLADGAGSAQRSEIGAQLACSLAFDEIRSLLETGGHLSDVDAPFLTGWLARFQTEIAARAEAEELKARDFACTLLGAVVGCEAAVFFQIGDGAIVVSPRAEEDEYSWVFWPATGEYENTTFFATEPDAAEHLEHAHVERPIDEVALFSDGLQRLVLDYRSRTAPAPFFRSMLSWVRSATDEALPRLSPLLQGHLSSPSINERTDDDKTLILATRRRDEIEAEADRLR